LATRDDDDDARYDGSDGNKDDDECLALRGARRFGVNGDRRSFLSGSVSLVCLWTMFPSVSNGEMVMFPVSEPLSCQYVFMRAGTSLLEEEDIWSTNPLFLTNAESSLSEKGIAEVELACQKLKEMDVPVSVIKYSFSKSSMDSAEVAKNILRLGQNKVVPEFNFMDPRAIGRWDGMSISQTLPAIVALDELEAGKDGKGGRPPPNDDGTPHETLADQSVRLRQLLSLLETNYSGDTILVVFPDATGPALLSAMMAGIPYSEVHRLDFAPGEVRVNVTPESVRALYEERRKADVMSTETGTQDYNTVLATGKQELKRLRSLDSSQIVTKKDLMIENERAATEAKTQEAGRKRMENERVARERTEAKAQEASRKRMENERKARERRQSEVRRAREPSDKDSGGESVAQPRDGMSAGTGVSELSLGPVLGAVGTVAAAQFAMRGGEDEDVDIETAAGDPIVPSDGGEGDLERNVTGTSAAVDSERSTNEAALHSDMIPEQSLPEKANDISTSLTEEERQEAATAAMDEYLDLDDGGDAWLRAMQEIVEEDADSQGTPMDAVTDNEAVDPIKTQKWQ